MDDSHDRHDGAKTRDLALGVVALSLAAAALLTIPSQVSRDAFTSFGNIRSPAFFPVITSALLALFSILLVVRSRPIAGKHKEHGGNVLPGARVLVVATMLFAAGLSLGLFGFIPTAFALIIGMSVAFGARSYRAVIALAIAVPAAIHLLFRTVLNVLLPGGVLF